MNINELTAARFKFLSGLYERRVEADSNGPTCLSRRVLGLRPRAYGPDYRLSSWRRFDSVSGDGWLSPNHSGRNTRGRGRPIPSRPVDHAFSTNQCNSIGSMVNSSVQQASPGTHQVIQINAAEIEDIQKLLSEIKHRVAKLDSRMRKKPIFKLTLESPRRI